MDTEVGGAAEAGDDPATAGDTIIAVACVILGWSLRRCCQTCQDERARCQGETSVSSLHIIIPFHVDFTFSYTHTFPSNGSELHRHFSLNDAGLSMTRNVPFENRVIAPAVRTAGAARSAERGGLKVSPYRRVSRWSFGLERMVVARSVVIKPF